MTSAIAAINERVRDRVRSAGFDPSAERERAAAIAHAEVRRHNDFALARSIPMLEDEAACVREVLANLSGYGPLQPYFDDPSVEELWINAPDKIFFARGGISHRAPLTLDETAVRDLVERMLQSSGRRIDLSQPFVDASLPDGSKP